jgi:hypothetical protein
MQLAFNAYPEGSYFGDSDIDILGGTNERDSTAIVEKECHLLVLQRKDLNSLIEDFKAIGASIKDIAN